MPAGTDLSFQVESAEDAEGVPGRVREMCLGLGFETGACEEVALVARELCLNIIHHGGGGSLAVRAVEHGERTGVELEATDEGAGIPDVEEAFRDGHSTRGSFGYGLGTVNRLMHGVDVQSPPPEGPGTRILARRWRYPESPPSDGLVDAGLASRPCPGYDRNGDAFLLSSWGRKSLVAVIDGLGHGDRAHRAARAARTYVAGHAREPLEAIFRGTDRACRPTRGVVMALVRFDWAREHVTVGNVGNIDIRVFDVEEPLNFAVRRGFLGRRGPEPAIRTVPWPSGATLVLHTDGIRHRGLADHYRELRGEPTQVLARKLLSRLARSRDDATVALLRRRRE